MITLKNRQDCCGCEACTSICNAKAITLKADNEGFIYPSIDHEKCTNCGACDRVCPVINQGQGSKPTNIFSAINQDEKCRDKSSSGGVFSLLAQKTIERGGVIYGVRFTERFEVEHTAAESIDELEKFRGSKYVQSHLGDSFKEIKELLKADREVLFSGTPCQVAALKLFLHRDYRNLTLIDFTCHGVPSPLVWRKYLNEVEAKHGTIESINLRDKRCGWRRYGVAINGTALSGESYSTYEKFFENSYIRGFLNDLYLRPSCHACPAKAFKSGSDLTIADYWGVERQQPEMDDDKGTSLVMINTPKGSELFNEINCQKQETSEQAIQKIAYSSIKPHRKRKEFFYHLEKGDRTIAEMVKTYTKKPWYKKYTRKIGRLIEKLLKR